MARSKSLADLITVQSLEAMAGNRSYARGEDYFRRSAVTRMRVGGDRITARVEGSDSYTARLWNDRGEPGYDCSCPVGEDGEFCKHLVATGLAWLARQAEPDENGDASEMDIIRTYLDACDKTTLVDLLAEQALEDEALAGRLLLAAQRCGHSDPRLLKQKIRDAFTVRGFIDYKHMRAFAGRVSIVPELIAEILRQGDAAGAAGLAAYAARRALKALEQADDSDGRLGEIVKDIAGIFGQAVEKGGLAPRELARVLFDLQLADGFGFFELEEFLPVLGEEGLAAYRKLAAQAWEKVPALAPGAQEDRHENQRYPLSEIMKTLARLDGDTDALIDVLRRDLTQPWTYLEIAELLAKANRHDEALQWAKQGEKAFPGELNVPLDDFLVKEYHRRQRHDAAVALRWSRFTEHSSLPAYQELKAAARAKSWPAWREKALDFLQKGQREEAKSKSSRWWLSWDMKGVILVEVHLWEGDPRAALDAARKTQCPAALWLKVAEALEADSPDEAITIYQAQIEPIVRMANNQAYDEATEIIRHIRDLMDSTGKAAHFAAYIDSVRAQHKPKRNFMQRLDRLAAEQTS